MEVGVETVFLRPKLEVIDSSPEVEVHQIVETQTVITTVEEVDWTLPLTITPAIVEDAENEILIDTLPDDSENFMSEECDTEYILVETDDTTVSDEPTEPYYIFADGNIKCVDEVLLENEEGEITLGLESVDKPKKPKTHFCKAPGCGRGYSTQHHLKVHERNHTGERPFKCPTEGCNKEFNRDYSLKAHLRIHTGERPYDCSYEDCGKAFKTSGDLQKHIRIHTGVRPFVCPIEGCGKAFATSNTCKIHTRTHTGEKPYICPEEGCEKEFSSSTNFKNHLRIHSGERPYSCSVAGCEKRFTEYSSLYKHRLTHSVSKRYQCGYCDKAYRQMTTLTTHKRAVHGVVNSEEGELLLDVEQMIEGESGDTDLESVSCRNAYLSGDPLNPSTRPFLEHSEDGSSLYVYEYESFRM